MAAGSPRRRENPRALLGPHGLAVIVIIAEALFAARLAIAGFFFADDFSNLSIAKHASLNSSYLTRSVFGHLIPLFNLSNYLEIRTWGYDYRGLVLFETLFLIAILIAFYSLANMVSGGPAYRNVVFMGLLGLSPILLPSILWWSNGLSNLPTIALTLFAVRCFLGYEIYHKWRYIWMYLASFVVALGLFDSALMIPVVVAVIWCLYIAPSPRPRVVIPRFLADWPLWAASAIPAVVDLGFRKMNSAKYTLPATTNPALLWHFVWTAWALGFAPAMIGITYPVRAVLHRPGLGVTLGQVCVVGVILVTSILRRHAWRAWVAFLVLFFIDLVITGYAHAGHGPSAGLEYDYLIFGPALFFMALVMATSDHGPLLDFLAAHGVVESKHARRSRVARLRVGPRVALGAVGLTLVAALVANTMVASVALAKSTSTYEPDSFTTFFPSAQSPHTSRIFFNNLERSARLIEQRTPQFLLYDAMMPSTLIPAEVFGRQGSDSVAVGAIYPTLPFNRVLGPGYMISTSGAIVGATFQVLASASTPLIGTCIGGAGPRSVRIPISQGTSLPAQPLPLLRIAYSAKHRSLLKMQFETAASQSLGTTEQLLSPKRHVALTDAPSAPVSQVIVTLPSAITSVCINSLTFGVPEPIP